MSPDEEAHVKGVMAGIPALAGYRETVERLGGLTNKVYQAGNLVLRIAGEGTAQYINRQHEEISARLAAQAGVSPEVIYSDAAAGVMVTKLVHASTTMSPQQFRERAGSPGRAGRVLRQLHLSGGEFPFRFELFAMIDEYLAILATKDVALPAGYHDVVTEAESIRRALARNPAALVPCHCDPLCENFLDTGSRMWLVDWEYSGMNDPMWDLGDLSVEAGFDVQQDRDMLQAYFGGEPSLSDHGRMVIYKAMCDLLWTLWGLIQLANKNPADDFNAYANGRFERCKTLMALPEFSVHLRAI